MPIYEYRCQDCNRLFSKLQPMGADSSGVSCPDCAGERVERQLSTFASGSSTASASGIGGPQAGCGHAGGG
jgi:putative FmdB family regulatory protein